MSEQGNEQEHPVRDDWTEEHTGRGGSLGVPAFDGDDELPDSGEVESHEVVSGGGVVEHEELDGTDSPEGTTEVD